VENGNVHRRVSGWLLEDWRNTYDSYLSFFSSFSVCFLCSRHIIVNLGGGSRSLSSSFLLSILGSTLR